MFEHLGCKNGQSQDSKAGEFYAVKNLEACHESDESRLTLGNWPVIARNLCLHNVRFPVCLILNLEVALQYINIGIISLTSTRKISIYEVGRVEVYLSHSIALHHQGSCRTR